MYIQTLDADIPDKDERGRYPFLGTLAENAKVKGLMQQLWSLDDWYSSEVDAQFLKTVFAVLIMYLVGNRCYESLPPDAKARVNLEQKLEDLDINDEDVLSWANYMLENPHQPLQPSSEYPIKVPMQPLRNKERIPIEDLTFTAYMFKSFPQQPRFTWAGYERAKTPKSELPHRSTIFPMYPNSVAVSSSASLLPVQHRLDVQRIVPEEHPCKEVAMQRESSPLAPIKAPNSIEDLIQNTRSSQFSINKVDRKHRMYFKMASFLVSAIEKVDSTAKTKRLKDSESVQRLFEWIRHENLFKQYKPTNRGIKPSSLYRMIANHVQKIDGDKEAYKDSDFAEILDVIALKYPDSGNLLQPISLTLQYHFFSKKHYETELSFNA